MSAMGTKPCRSVRGIDPADCGHRIVAGADYFWDGDRAYCSPACVERSKREEAMETSDVPFLLAGLGVGSIKELHDLVEAGRKYEEVVGPVRDELRAAGVPEDLLPA